MKLLKNRLFLVTTLLPTLLAAVYFGFIAADVYVSESHYVVRSPEKQGGPSLGALLKNAGFANAQDDSYVVQDFILSRDALRTVNDELHLAGAFGSSKVDLLSRFAGIDWDDSLEALHRYYQKKVGVQFDSASSITTLTTRAFTADDAVALNRRLLELSEGLVNRLNARARDDLIRFASAEVADAEAKARDAGLALASYRNAAGVLDPEKQAEIPLQLIGKLQDDLIVTRWQIAQLEQVARDNPQLPVLRLRVGLLQKEMAAAANGIAGAGDHSLAGKAVEYQRLRQEKEFADKMLASALSTLEDARNEAQRKQLYLERISEPSRPDAALEPRRAAAVLATFAIGLVLFGVLTMLAAGLREHLD